jgi:DNA-3-methyladenine glycosylase I
VPARAAARPRRCAWAELDPLLGTYHDEEWGVPVHDGRRLWEMLMLEGFQAGLSWLTILRRRDAFRRAFANFDPEGVARFGGPEVGRLLADPGIIRSRAKIEATIAGARAYLAMRVADEEFGDFSWAFVRGQPLQAGRRAVSQTPLSAKISKELKSRGFRFVGPVIVYAWMQSVGLVNDHAPFCFRHREIAALG